MKPTRLVLMLFAVLALASFSLAGCGDDDSGDLVDAAATSDASALDGAPARQSGETCGQSAAGARCASGLMCCYPCGIPGCEFRCEFVPRHGACLLRP